MKKIRFPFPTSRNDELRGGAGWDRIEKSLQEIAGFINSGNDAISAAVEAAEAAQDAAETAASTAMSGTPDGYSDVLASMAEEFNAEKAYTSGTYVWRNSTLYLFTSDHAAGTWTGTDAEEAVISDELTGLNSNIINSNAFDIMPNFATYTDRTSGGVKYTWSNDKLSCHAKGTSNALSITNIYALAALPSDLSAGKTYFLEINTSNTNLLLEIMAYTDSSMIDDVLLTSSRFYTIPSAANKICFRVRTRYSSGSPSVVDDDISIKIYTVLPNNVLTDKALIPLDHFMQIFPKYTTIGDSLMSGYVHTNDVTVSSATAKLAGNNWVTYLNKRIGQTLTNLAEGGSTAKQWRDSLLSSAHIDTDAYIINIGVNDLRESLTIGTSSDIKTNFADNTDSFYGNYDYIIRQLMAWYPNAHIFAMTITLNGTEDFSAINTAIANIIARYPAKAHLIDTRNYAFMFKDPLLINSYMNGHYTTIGYNRLSTIYEMIINDYIKNNLSLFTSAPYA